MFQRLRKTVVFILVIKSNNKSRDDDYNEDHETITKHFDFRLNGNINGHEIVSKMILLMLIFVMS